MTAVLGEERNHFRQAFGWQALPWMGRMSGLAAGLASAGFLGRGLGRSSGLAEGGREEFEELCWPRVRACCSLTLKSAARRRIRWREALHLGLEVGHLAFERRVRDRAGGSPDRRERPGTSPAAERVRRP